MESYHVPHGPKKGIWFADQAGLDQFIAIAKTDKEMAPVVSEWQATNLFSVPGTTLAPIAGIAVHIAEEDDLTILRSNVTALIDVWNYGVDSPVAAARQGDINRLSAAMFRRQERAAKKQKWNA